MGHRLEINSLILSYLISKKKFKAIGFMYCLKQIYHHAILLTLIVSSNYISEFYLRVIGMGFQN